jgi:hypothetical protein
VEQPGPGLHPGACDPQRAFDDLGEIDARLDDLAAFAEASHVLDDGHDPVHALAGLREGLLHVGEPFGQGRVEALLERRAELLPLRLHQVQVRAHERHRVVDLVGDACREPAHRLEALGTLDPLLERPPLGDAAELDPDVAEHRLQAFVLRLVAIGGELQHGDDLAPNQDRNGVGRLDPSLAGHVAERMIPFADPMCRYGPAFRQRLARRPFAGLDPHGPQGVTDHATGRGPLRVVDGRELEVTLRRDLPDGAERPIHGATDVADALFEGRIEADRLVGGDGGVAQQAHEGRLLEQFLVGPAEVLLRSALADDEAPAEQPDPEQGRDAVEQGLEGMGLGRDVVLDGDPELGREPQGDHDDQRHGRPDGGSAQALHDGRAEGDQVEPPEVRVVEPARLQVGDQDREREDAEGDVGPGLDAASPPHEDQVRRSHRDGEQEGGRDDRQVDGRVLHGRDEADGRDRAARHAQDARAAQLLRSRRVRVETEIEGPQPPAAGPSRQAGIAHEADNRRYGGRS